MKKYNITVNGKLYEVMVEEVTGESAAQASSVSETKPAAELKPQIKTEPAVKQSSNSGSQKITCPMPGTILKINVSEGKAVKKGEILCILEAMKMENEIIAPADSVIATINAKQGAAVKAGDILFTFN